MSSQKIYVWPRTKKKHASFPYIKKKTQMEEFKSAVLDLIKYQQKQQLSLQKQQIENQRRMEELHIEIQRQILELDKSAKTS